MSIFTLLTHLSSIMGLVNSAVSFVKAVIAAKAMPSASITTDFLEGLRGVFDSGLIPMTPDEQKALDEAFAVIEAQFKK